MRISYWRFYLVALPILSKFEEVFSQPDVSSLGEFASFRIVYFLLKINFSCAT